MDGVRIGVDDRPHDSSLAVEILAFESAKECEVEQADAPVRAQQAVVGVRVAGDDAFAPEETKEEAEHDLANAVALRLVELRNLLRPQPVHVLGDEHASGREIRVHAWHTDVRVPLEQPREAALLLRLDLVVELAGDPLAHLAQQRSSVATRRKTRDDRADEPDRPQVAVDRVADVRVLNLHRDVLAVTGVRAVDLTDGSDREWLLVEGGKYILHARVEILLDHSSHCAERKRLWVFNQRAERTRLRLT